MIEVLTFWLTEDEETLVKYHARQCSLGGRSNIRGSDRQSNLKDDQIFGQCCELGGWMSFYNREEGLKLYDESRNIRNADPWASDNGNDVEIPGIVFPIDIKGSKMRYGHDPLKYNLVYPLNEHNDATMYILGLARYSNLDKKYCVHMVGWIMGRKMPPPRDFKGFGDRRWTEAHNLNSLTEFS